MTKEEIVKQVKDIIVDKLGVEESEVGIKIPDEETSGIATVGDAIAKVTEKLGE